MPLHTVIETWAYLAAAEAAGMSEEELVIVVDLMASKPDAGVVMPGAEERGNCAS